MRRLFSFLFVIIVIAGVGYVVLRFMGFTLPGQAMVPSGQNAPAPTATAPILPPVRASADQVLADARVVPVQSASLSLPASGIVAEVLVDEGDQVTAGQALVRLNAARQRASLAQSEAELRRAQARLAETIAGSREQEIAAAQASVEAAQAQLDKVQQGPKAEDIQAARASVASAQAELRSVLAGPDEEELIAAKAEMDNADAKRRQAQAAYDRVAGSPDIGRLPEAVQLEQATNDYNAARARYEALQKGADPSAVAAARAKVDRAQAELDALLAPPSAAEIAAAQAEVRRAQAELDLRLAGARDEEVAAAQADVAAAEAAVQQAEAAVAEMELVAPFTGTIASLDVVLGQQVAAGEPVVRIADFSNWRVETDDLTELDVVGILPNDQVRITFDAIPDLELPGRVLRIKSIGESRQGDITYTVIVVPERTDSRLLWNMTATVLIEPGSSSRLQAESDLAAAATPVAGADSSTTPASSITAAGSAPAAPVESQEASTTSEITDSADATAAARATAIALQAAAATSSDSIGATPTEGANTGAENRPDAATLAPAASATASPTTAPTETLTSTPTATPVPATATPTATETTAPATATPTLTPSPTRSATATPTRPAALAPTPRPPTPTPVPPTATPRPAVSPPEPVSPAPNQTVGGNVLFQWLPTGDLSPGTAYEAVWWNPEEDPNTARGFAAPTTGNSAEVNLDVLYDSDQIRGLDIYWTVLVVQVEPYTRLVQPADSNWRILRYQPTAGEPPKPR